jgi:hypothetical protein
MPKARITNLRADRRRLLGAWLGTWLDDALRKNSKAGKPFPGWSQDETRKVLLTLKDLREDCGDDKEIVETGGLDDVVYGRRN